MAKNLEIPLLLDIYGPCLTEKQRELVTYYYNDDLSLSEIAENEGITRQGVRDAVKRSETLLLKLEEELGFYARQRENAKRVATIRDSMVKIAEVNRRYGSAREINDLTQMIYDLAEEID
ncbi:MAG: DNA-binding protein [Oscillospiraceae bacterium]|nr:DNA-binding protein [Oscillospiraceae bacterium]